jgi:uncharacterized protein
MYRMKICQIGFLFSILAYSCTTAQKTVQPVHELYEKTLLWQISGKGLQKPSYLFGTIHLVCKEDAQLGDSLLSVIHNTDQVYFEVDMDNLFEIFGVIRHMKMKNDTTLADLLTEKEYKKIKQWFETKNSLLPFSMLETYKPLLAASTIMESGMECEGAVAMEQVIMEEAKKYKKRVSGLESMAYQMSIFDSIPYKIQAQQLLKFIEDDGKESNALKEYDELQQAYRDQDLDKLDELMRRNDLGIARFEEILLHNRNRNWVNKLKTILPEKSIIIAVGAGHLPGRLGVISLLRKEGFTVKPMMNKGKKQAVI